MHFALKLHVALSIFIKHDNEIKPGIVSAWSDGHETMLSLFQKVLLR